MSDFQSQPAEHPVLLDPMHTNSTSVSSGAKQMGSGFPRKRVYQCS
jgi:hypothetical protein